MSPAAGTRLGPYGVVELLGAGGMGAAYRARDPRLGRDVANKALADDVASDPDRLRRFEQEARTVAALNYQNVPSVYDVGTQPSDQSTNPGTPSTAMPYVVAELLVGGTLGEVLSRRSPTQRPILGWAVQTSPGKPGPDRQRRDVSGPALDRLGRRRQHTAAADARSRQAALAQAAARRAAGEASFGHEPPHGARREVLDRLDGRGRSIPWLEGRADVARWQ